MLWSCMQENLWNTVRQRIFLTIQSIRIPSASLNSIPKLGSGQEEHLYTIEGTVPGLDEMLEGCRFCTRCQHATEQCRKKDPGMREVDGHMVRCFLYGKEGEN